MKAANLLSQYASTPQADQARLELLSLQQPGQLDALMAVEQRAYSHPWSRGNFTDSLASGYQIELLLGGEQVIGYFVAMPGVEEAHLLNITVAPEFQQQGWSVVLLDALALWARGRGAQGCGWKCASATCARAKSMKNTVFSASASASATTPVPAQNAKMPSL